MSEDNAYDNKINSVARDDSLEDLEEKPVEEKAGEISVSEEEKISVLAKSEPGLHEITEPELDLGKEQDVQLKEPLPDIGVKDDLPLTASVKQGEKGVESSRAKVLTDKLAPESAEEENIAPVVKKVETLASESEKSEPEMPVNSSSDSCILSDKDLPRASQNDIQKKAEPLLKPNSSAPKIGDDLENVKTVDPRKPAPSMPFAVKFLNHLGILRKQANQKRAENMEKNLKHIIEEAWKTERITNDDVERIIKVGDRQALNYLKKLVKQGKLMRFGKGRGVYYKPLR